MTISYDKPNRSNFKDLTGKKFGRLTVIKFSYKKRYDNGQYRIYWQCQCNCEDKTVLDIAGNDLKVEDTRSCGCLHAELASERAIKHKCANTLEYSSWQNMKSRCYNKNNPKYAIYGGRGVKVCKRWLDKENGFENFLEDMGLKSSGKDSIERVDNNGNYTPENCKWATRSEQQRNTSRNVMLTFRGKTMCLQEWSIEVGINRMTLRTRINNGWSVKRAFTTPVR